MKTTLLIAALACGLTAANATGQGIVYFDYDPSSATGGIEVGENLPRRDFNMDLNGDGTVDFRFSGKSDFEAGFQLVPLGANKVLGYPGSNDVSPAIRARRLLTGSDISASAPSASSWYGYRPTPSLSVEGPYLVACLSPVQCSGDFRANGAQLTQGYVGIQFTAADGLHYGWIRVLGGVENDGTILDYAYNTVPGQGLAAGVVPEPGTLALLGLGVLCLWRFRRAA